LNRPVIEYRAALGDIPAQLERELAELNRVGAKVKKLALKTLQNPDYGDRQDDPPNVRKAIADLTSVCRGAIETLEQTPGKIEHLLSRIRGRTREHFSGWAPATLANEDRIEANSLLHRAAALEKLPEEIARLEARIDEAVAFWQPREKQGQGPRLLDKIRGVFSRQPEHESPKVKPDFDPRLD
jgi:hypothetical protein